MTSENPDRRCKRFIKHRQILPPKINISETLSRCRHYWCAFIPPQNSFLSTLYRLHSAGAGGDQWRWQRRKMRRRHFCMVPGDENGALAVVSERPMTVWNTIDVALDHGRVASQPNNNMCGFADPILRERVFEGMYRVRMVLLIGFTWLVLSLSPSVKAVSCYTFISTHILRLEARLQQ